MKKIITFIKHYIIAIFIFLTLGVLLKIVESIYFTRLEESINFYCVLKSFLSLLIVYCFYSILLLPIYIFLNFINKITARIIISIIFSLLLILETGLTIYLFNTGALMGAELVIRTISEVISTIKTIVNLWIPILVIIFNTIIFYLILSFLNKKIKNNKALLIIFTVVSIISIFITFIPKLHNATKNPTIDNYIQNKSFYCFNSIRGHFLSEQKYKNDIFYDEERIAEFIQEYPERKIINKYYPLEREYKKNNVLAPYFKKDTIKPNIVIFVLESLGREWNADLSFTPFLDSLANTGLYWKNCISTTKRSFGIIPSITGSLPFGVKGFQFNNMPEHNSLIKFLKNNNYKANVFYAGTFGFDAINDYLLEQNIDYMSENFYNDYEKNKTEYNGKPYWGYQDSIMYSKVLQDQNFLNDTIPFFNILITISSHQDPDRNNPYFQRAYKLTNEIIMSATKEKQNYYLKKIDRATSIVYQDLCLKEFFLNYKKRKDFDNTIFIFTGDHASGVMQKNDLSRFHVPLVIWSSLLLNHKTFPALVSHNDFVPTIETLLKENYNLKFSPYVHWIGNYLDTSSQFVSNLKTVMFDYSDGYKDIIYKNYYYNNQLFEIKNENLDLEEIKNDSLIEFMQNKLNLYRYIHKYVYVNNKITNYPLFTITKYKTINDIFTNKIVSVSFESYPKWKKIVLYPQTVIEGKWEKIKISITADVMFYSTPENQEYYELMITCNGENMQNANHYTDKINKYITVENIELKKWYPINIEKQFLVENASNIKMEMYFFIGANKPNNYSKWKNIRILVEGKNYETKDIN